MDWLGTLSSRRVLRLVIGVVFSLVVLVFGVWRLWDTRVGAVLAPLPTPLADVEEPEPAVAFDFPLAQDHFGPYIPYETGPLAVDTRFGAQNPGLGKTGKCFVDVAGTQVPFESLYHAGEDWFAYNAERKVSGRSAAGADVHAVANGVVTWEQSLGSEGHVVVVEHHLPDGARIWSVYWHVADVGIAVGEAVLLGQRVGSVHDRGFNSHLHWEIRTFADGTALFPPDSAGGRGTCNGYVMGVGYTWDDDLERAQPESWGYLNPSEFIIRQQERNE